jgi:collagenase-like PrtC family protease
MNKKFCLPYNGIFQSEEIVDNYQDKIYEFYGDDSVFNSAIRSYGKFLTEKERFENLQSTVKYLFDRNIFFNYTLNSFDIREYVGNKEKNFIDNLKRIKDIGVDSVTITHPYLAHLVKNVGLKVVNSILLHVNSETKANYLIKFGFDRIILDNNYNKRIKEIKYLKTILPSNISLEMLSNNGCKKDCPNEFSDYLGGYIENIQKFCTAFCKEETNPDISEFLKRNFIRNVDISKYENIGVNLFKIPGRMKSNGFLNNGFRYWLSDEYKSPDIYYLKKYFNIIKNESELDDYFDFLFSDAGCSGHCSECGFCDRYAKKLLNAI